MYNTYVCTYVYTIVLYSVLFSGGWNLPNNKILTPFLDRKSYPRGKGDQIWPSKNKELLILNWFEKVCEGAWEILPFLKLDSTILCVQVGGSYFRQLVECCHCVYLKTLFCLCSLLYPDCYWPALLDNCASGLNMEYILMFLDVCLFTDDWIKCYLLCRIIYRK